MNLEQIQTLKKRVENDLVRISMEVSHLERSLAEPSSMMVTAAQAHFLTRFYTGLESVFEKAFKLAGEKSSIKGEGFHQQLLEKANSWKLVPEQSHEFLRDLLKFRHQDRHGYGVEMRADEVKSKAVAAVQLWPLIKDRFEELLSTEANRCVNEHVLGQASRGADAKRLIQEAKDHLSKEGHGQAISL